MLLPSVIVTAALVSSSFAAHVLVEKRAAPPAAWKRASVAALEPDFIIPLRIGLRQSNLHRIDEELRAVSDPTSSTYGQHWTAKQIAKFFEPTTATVSAVQSWLEDAGFEPHRLRLTGGNSWITLNVTVAEAEALLDTRYAMYTHRTGAIRPATTEYSVPAHIRHHVDIITPTLHFDLPEGRDNSSFNKRSIHSSRKPSLGDHASGNGPKLSPLGFTGAYEAVAAAGELSNCVNLTTIACLEALYNFGGYAQTATKLNSFEYDPNSYAPQDLDMFFAQYKPAAVGARPDTHTLDGGFITPVPSNFEVNGESDLDLEYAMGITYPLIPVLYQVGTDGSFNTFLDGLDASYCTYDGGDDPTQDAPYGNFPGDCGSLPYTAVISTSYASNEADATPKYEERQCYEYAKLGMQGTTFLFSSGDYGVAGNLGECYDRTTGQDVPSEEGVVGVTFNPSFPGTCPYVTSVGGTQTKAGADLVNDPANAEEACEASSPTVIYSGGGFSNVFPIPDYQKKAVGLFFEDNLPYYSSLQYNNSQATRGFPDLSASASNYAVSYAGANGMVYGTSASSPVVAAIITLINDARYAAGKGPVGFINPAIYSEDFAKGFNDIIAGGNQGCGTPGFTAVKGWDPVTGVGTPDFGKLKELWLALP